MSQNNPINLNFNPLNLLNIILVNTYKGSVIADIIKADTFGPWAHAMGERKLAEVISQEWLLVEENIGKYLTANNILGFWQIANLTFDEWTLINNAIQADLNAPFWNRLYNGINLLGQLLRQYWISMPGQCICSQRVAKYLRLLPRLALVVPSDPSPVDLGNIFQNNPTLFNFVGYWWQI